MGNEEVCESTNDWSFNVRGGTKNECSIDRKLLKMFGWISIANISQLSKLTPASNSQSQVQLFRISCSPPTNEPDNEWELPFFSLQIPRHHYFSVSIQNFTQTFARLIRSRLDNLLNYYLPKTCQYFHLNQSNN